MAVENLSCQEKLWLGQCLTAAADGPFFEDDDEFDTIFGVSREEVAEVAQAWPKVGDGEVVELALSNSVGNLLGYPHGRMKHWSKYISASPEEVRQALDHWRRLKD